MSSLISPGTEGLERAITAASQTPTPDEAIAAYERVREQLGKADAQTLVWEYRARHVADIPPERLAEFIARCYAVVPPSATPTAPPAALPPTQLVAPEQHPSIALFQRGVKDLVSVIPPGAQLTPNSRISPTQIGKVPGLRTPHGLWYGWDWRRHPTTLDDVEKWATLDGANIGIRTDRFPGVDLDVKDAVLAQIIEDAARAKLGPAPVRTGNPPKRLLMYRTNEPFARMRLWITKDEAHHLVEILGQGQQFVSYGTHPGTMKPYEWDTDPAELGAEGLTPITRGQASDFLDYLAATLPETAHVSKVEREGDGRPSSRAAGDQAQLMAPSLDALREAVALVPNDNEHFPSRTDYLRMGYAIRAAAGPDDEDEGFAIFAAWAAKWEGNDRFDRNEPDVVHADWHRMREPYSVGWSWIAEQARPFGFNDAGLEFEAVATAPDELAAVPAYIARFNRLYAKVRGVSNAVLYTPTAHEFDYLPHRHWEQMVANDRVFIKGKSVAVSKLWMEHPKRRQFEIEVFDPTQPPLTGVPSRVDGAQDFNAWPGFAVSPTREGSCQLFLDHLRDVVSCGNEEVYEWVIMWLAAMVQKPHELPGTALVLRGAQGTGKSLSGEILGAMLGDRLYTIVSGSEELTGRFNVQLARRLLIQVEEAFFAANRGIVGRLKNMITSPLMRVERKGIDPFEIPNCARLLITSNESWVVPAEEGERRFMVLDVSDAHKNDHAYFGALRRQMLDEAGTSRLLEHLLHEVHVKDDVIRRPLATDALRDQQLRSMAAERRWFLDVLAEGVLPGDDRGKGVALFDDLYTSYVHSARDYHGGTRTLDKVAFGRFLIECGATKYRPRSQGRASMRRFPPLHQCRATFARGLATTPDWEEAADWQAGCEVLGGVA